MRRSIRLAVSAAALFAAAAGIAYATNTVTANATSELHACANATNGNLRLVEDGAACREAEQPVSWNVTGPAGADGTNGTNGKDGTNGTDGVSPTVAQLAAGDENCPAGGVAITGADGAVGYVCNGAKGDPGEKGESGDPFSGHFTSPNGAYSVDVGDTGIVLTGPAGKVTLDATSVSVDADSSLRLRSGASLQLDAGTLLDLGAKALLKAHAPVAQLTGQVTLGSTACAPALRSSDPLQVVVGPDGGVAPVQVLGFSNTVCVG
jgi:hypothetical protein